MQGLDTFIFQLVSLGFVVETPPNLPPNILRSTPNCDVSVTLQTDGQTIFFICVLILFTIICLQWHKVANSGKNWKCPSLDKTSVRPS